MALHRAAFVAPLMLLAVVGAAALMPADGIRAPFVLLVSMPIAEELIFRAGLQEALLRRGLRPLTSSVLTALAFGAAHAVLRSPWLGLAVLPASFLLSAVYLRWRRVGPCVAAHAAMNLAWLLATS